MSEGLESQLIALVREVRALQHRVDMLRVRDSANSRTMQAELLARIQQREQQLAELRAQTSAPTRPDGQG